MNTCCPVLTSCQACTLASALAMAAGRPGASRWRPLPPGRMRRCPRCRGCHDCGQSDHAGAVVAPRIELLAGAPQLQASNGAGFLLVASKFRSQLLDDELGETFHGQSATLPVKPSVTTTSTFSSKM